MEGMYGKDSVLVMPEYKRLERLRNELSERFMHYVHLYNSLGEEIDKYDSP